MASALCIGPLASTPPVTTPRTSGPGSGRRSSLTVSFSRGSASEEVGSWKAGSFAENYSQSFTLSRSLGRSLGRTPEGGSLRPQSAAARPAAQRQASIPKSASFVRQEGFMASPQSESALATPPASPQPRSGLLSRQFSTDGVLPLSGFSFDDPYAAANINRLEHSLRLSPSQAAPLAAPQQQRHDRSGSGAFSPAELLQKLQSQYDVFSEVEVVRAFNIAHAAHDGRHREDGEPAFMHCVEVARSLAGLGVDETSVAAALLHDVLDDQLLPEAQLRRMLGDGEVFDVVKQVAHLGNLSSMYRAHPASTPELAAACASSLVDMLVAMQHSRAVLVKLADRLHDMRTLGALPPATRRRMATETLDVWAPLANRVGLWNMKAPLEDLAFQTLHPAEYEALRGQLEVQQRPETLVRLVDRLRAELDKEGIGYTDLSGRPKHLYGVYQKLQKKQYTLEKICDVRGLRIIVHTKEECYRAQRVVETLWQSLDRNKDYIRNKKPNGYQSLHTVVRADDGHELEVQIRTSKMHYMAEYGDSTAHWLYKEGSTGAGGDTSAAKEASWAKYKVSQQVNDQKCRPSGSPPRDCSIMSGSFDSDSADMDPLHAKFDPRFLKFLQRTGQLVQQPELRTMVCVVRNGALDIHHLQPGTNVGELLQRYGGQPQAGAQQVVINRLPESNLEARLHTGDTVEIYTEDYVPAPPSPRVVGLPPPAPAVLQAQQQQRAAEQQVPEVKGTGEQRRPVLGGSNGGPGLVRSGIVSAAGIKGRLGSRAQAGLVLLAGAATSFELGG